MHLISKHFYAYIVIFVPILSFSDIFHHYPTSSAEDNDYVYRASGNIFFHYILLFFLGSKERDLYTVLLVTAVLALSSFLSYVYAKVHLLIRKYQSLNTCEEHCRNKLVYSQV